MWNGQSVSDLGKQDPITQMDKILSNRYCHHSSESPGRGMMEGGWKGVGREVGREVGSEASSSYLARDLTLSLQTAHRICGAKPDLIWPEQLSAHRCTLLDCLSLKGVLLLHQ